MPALDRYLHVQAGQDHRRHVAVCFVLPDVKRSRIAGYYTLSAYSIVAEGLPVALQRKLPRYGQIPCTLLGRLAVDNAYQSARFGRHLLVDALKRALIHSAEVASWALVVDAKDEASETFNRKYSFISLASARGRHFLPMFTISRLFT